MDKQLMRRKDSHVTRSGRGVGTTERRRSTSSMWRRAMFTRANFLGA